VTGRDSYAGRYWPTDWRAYFQLKGETIVPLHTPGDDPRPGDILRMTGDGTTERVPAPPGDAYTLFPELASLAALAHGTSELLHETIKLSQEQGDSLSRRIGEALRLTERAARVMQLAADHITDLGRRVEALEAHAATHGLPPAPAPRLPAAHPAGTRVIRNDDDDPDPRYGTVLDYAGVPWSGFLWVKWDSPDPDIELPAVREAADDLSPRGR
jgi:hypothetical protein